MNEYCPLCTLNSAGCHEDWCPNNPANKIPQKGSRSTLYGFRTEGWICPRCHKVWSPWVESCDCQQWASLPGGSWPVKKDAG